MADALVKLIIGIFAVVMIVTAVAYAIAVAAVLASIALGIVSVIIVKSARGLVIEESAGAAVMLACGWSAVLTVGCLLGSWGLLASLTTAFGSAYVDRLVLAFDVPETGSFWSIWIFLDRWIMGSAYSFFFKSAAIIFLANRIFIARKCGGSSWLGVIPPLSAMCLFFAVDHWNLIAQAVAPPSPAGISTLLQALGAVIYLPVKLLLMAFTEPNAVLSWVNEKITSSNGSMFKLAELFPTVFWLVAVAMGIKALSGSPTD